MCPQVYRFVRMQTYNDETMVYVRVESFGTVEGREELLHGELGICEEGEGFVVVGGAIDVILLLLCLRRFVGGEVSVARQLVFFFIVRKGQVFHRLRGIQSAFDFATFATGQAEKVAPLQGS